MLSQKEVDEQLINIYPSILNYSMSCVMQMCRMFLHLPWPWSAAELSTLLLMMVSGFHTFSAAAVSLTDYYYKNKLYPMGLIKKG